MGVMSEEYSRELNGALQETFGYPPDNLEERTNLMIRKSMPVVTFIPSKPQFQKGLDLFTLRPVWDEYSQLLRENGFTTPNNKSTGIKCAYLADNFPTDSFTNEYGENFLQKFTDVASEGAASIAQILGKETATGAAKEIIGGAAKTGGVIGKGVAKAGEYAGDILGAAYNALQHIPGGQRSANLVNRLMAGSRIDFPMVWKSSGFQPSYSFTIRLYNPFPQDDQYTHTYITGPVVALLLLGVPRAQDSSTFTWPFLHHISCPGLFDLNPGFISNITVVKGGDQQQISLNQRLGIVDVRIDVGSLYSSMLAGSSRVTSTRPTVLKYAQAISGKKKITSRQADNDNYTPRPGDINIGDGRSVGAVSRGEAIKLEGRKYIPPTPNFTTIRGRQAYKVSPKIQAESEEADETPNNRVSQEDIDLYDILVG